MTIPPLYKGIGPQDHARIGRVEQLPGATDGQFLSICPVVLDVPGRLVDLQMRITLPTSGGELPIVLLSHGEGTLNNLNSLNGMAPLAQHYAAHGFAVIQPTHLTSRSRKLPDGAPRPSLLWRTRGEDMKYILDHLDVLESLTPLISGRLDHSRVAVVGFSIGGHTAGLLLGLRVTEEDGTLVDLFDHRVIAGVILSAPGGGGESLTAYATEKLLFMRHPDFSHMVTPAVVVGGDADDMSSLTTQGPMWWVDSYTLSPAPKDLLTFRGGKHSLGGIAGWDQASTEEENAESPETVALVQRMTVAYLRSKLYSEDTSWEDACGVMNGLEELATVESKIDVPYGR